MDRKPEFVSQITNFPPLNIENNENTVSALLSKIFKFSKTAPAECPVETSPEDKDEKASLVNNESQNDNWKSESQDEGQQSRSSSSQYTEDTEGRSLQNVLRRFSNLVALKTSGGKFSDAEHTRYWMPDHVSRECYECGARFSAFRRRHHCRICGQIFCARCCSHRVPGQLYGCSGGLRVCTHCCKIVLGYLQNTDGTDIIPDDLKVLNDNEKDKTGKDFDKINESGFLQETISGDEGIENRNLLRHHSSLQDVFNKICRSLPLQHQRYRLIRYPGVWRGGEVLNWLLEHRIASTSSQAKTICQSFLNENFMECVTEHMSFVDYALYRPLSSPHSSNDNGMNVMIGSTSSFCLDLNLADSSARMIRGHKKDSADNVSNSESDNPLFLEGTVDESNGPHCSLVETGGNEHIRLLLVQSLVRAGLNLSWTNVLLPLCLQAANMVSIDITSSEWDIRRCVRVKRVAGGNIKECRAIPGVVFSKNLAHRAMATRIATPRLLLLKTSIGYQRVEGKLVSLEPVIMQEEEYLRQCCARILSFEPDLLLVSGAVSGLAQEQLRARGLALALGVRMSVLKRVARATRADILGSIDAHVARTPPRLGTCKAFYLLNYESKTLMVLEGYPNDLKCCSIIIRGAPLEELGKVKKVISLVLLAAYNWRLENSLLGDMAATLPLSNSLLVFNDNSKDNTPEDGDDCVFQEKSSQSGRIETNQSKETKDAISSDPLAADYAHKKIDPDKNKSCGITVEDFSDPLRACQLSVEDDVFTEDFNIAVQQDVQHVDTPGDRWKTAELLVSLSPQVRVAVPYLESEAGRRCPLRPYYRAPLFPPTHSSFYNASPHRKISLHNSMATKLSDPHPFVSQTLKHSAEESQVKGSLANFRACGGRLNFQSFKAKPLPSSKADDFVNISTKEADKSPLDPLDPEQHQRMYLLYYSFSSKSNNAPDFCVNPWIVRMDMYGNNDIPLGMFLERHCFSQQVVCTSTNCQIPLTHHVRKFVHGDGCITVTCNTVDSSASRTTKHHCLTDEDGKSPVMWWSRCLVCQSGSAGGGGSCVRPPSLALSLAKYLELRFHASHYIRAKACQHSLNHQHAHYFAQNNTTACFKYSKIKSWDICLPPTSIATHLNTRSMREGLINQINELCLKGHELFSSIENSEVDKDYALFRSHMDQIQLNLTSTSVQEQNNGAGVVKWLWGISDALVNGEKLLQDAIEKWTTQSNATKGSFKITQDIVDGKIESEENTLPDFNALDCAAEGRGLPNNITDVDHAGGEEEEDKNDKRGLRAMLSQLLNSSQPSHHNGVVLCNGVVPLIVRGSEVSSLAAAALASKHYQSMLLTASNSLSSDQEDKENGASNNKDKSDADGKTKNSRSNEHIDVQLQDGLSCRVYYAKQFLKLRSMLLCPLESNTNISNNFNMKAPTDTKDKTDSESLSTVVSNDDSVGCSKEYDATIHRQEKVERDILSSVESSPILALKHGATHMKLEPLSSVEEGFIRSLSRCIPWAARGGKSGSTFCKTIDDRYILKEMSKLELQLFVDLAPHYFHHIQSCHQNKLPTLLGRIVGVYRVDGVGGVGGGVLVMENLWHGRGELAQRFDLKGAQRNRLANQGLPDNVLLDENILKLRWECPLYIQSHSAGVLWAAVQRDTDFLASHHIMDYSLLVGLDSERQELVLGIIDYIRTFTWDKKLEHIVKKGLGSGLPTIVSPEQYKARFCTAMKKYFLQSPNQWEDLHRGLVSEQE